MSVESRCPDCGADLPTGMTEGLCPKCLMAAALDSSAEEQAVGNAYAPTTPMPADSPAGFTPPAVALLAEHFPQLEILELLGHGGMGAVYKARQTKLDRMVALKIIRPESADDPAFAERFMREARTLARLSHPNIVGIHDFGEVRVARDPQSPAKGGESRPLYFFIMEYVDGANLREWIESGELLPDEALAIVAQVCESLQYAHDEGVVHRDIKPENILLDSKGRVKIADFGLAKLAVRTPEDFTLTATHQVMGTPRYMAPEQMAGSRHVDQRADIYSLGVVLYEMLTGTVPLGHFEPPSKGSSLDPRLDGIVLQCLASDPDRRYQEVSELAHDIWQLGRESHGGHPTRVEWPGPSTLLGNAADWFIKDGVRGGGIARGLTHPSAPAIAAILLCLAGIANVFSVWYVATEYIGDVDAPADSPPSDYTGEVPGPKRGYQSPYGAAHASICFAFALVLFAIWTPTSIPRWRPWSLLSIGMLLASIAVRAIMVYRPYSHLPQQDLWDDGCLVGFGIGIALLVAGAWDLRLWLSGPSLPKRRPRRPFGRSADSASSLPAKPSSTLSGGRDWVTLTREQIERDQLPDLCIVCGAETHDRLSKEFGFQAQWAQILTVIGMIFGFFPGLIVAAFTEQRQRIACPVCPAHKNHWSKFVWFASLGWLLCVPFGLAGLLVARLSFHNVFGPSWYAVPCIIVGILVGLIVYGVMLARMAGRRPSIETMSATEVRLRPVSAAFARAAEDGGRESDSSKPTTEADSGEASVPDDIDMIAVKAEVDGPALVMCFTGILMLLGNLVAVGVYLSISDIDQFFWIPIPGLLVGGAMLTGGLSLRKLQSYGWAQLGAVAGLLPVNPGWLLSGPIGAWLLNYILNKDTVRQAFVQGARSRHR